MEPGMKKYLLRIVNTLAMGLLWMAVNCTLGIKYDLGFVHDHITRANLLFYLWFLISLAAFLWWVIWVWSKPLDIEQ
ncbi:hypothetical protein [Sediminibacterium soli]|uniref:hypothetical protein n=1 Tax=Sediminibacterium soli TaxID=2698829 RepID=UPI001379B241|nr:hypothetical protein [Sediminibacterium soli]NCI47588.1 hypothetical protein [Sediminibacterium soli]